MATIVGKNSRGGIAKVGKSGVRKTDYEDFSGNIVKGTASIDKPENKPGVLNAVIATPSKKKVTAPIVATADLATEDLANKQTQFDQLQQDVANHQPVADVTEPKPIEPKPEEPKKEKTLDEQINEVAKGFGIDETPNETPKSQEEKDLIANEQQRKKVELERDSKASTAIARLDKIASGVYPLNTSEKALLASTKQAFQSVIEAQKVANQAYTGQMKELAAQRGFNMTTPDQAIGLAYQAISTGNAKIADLNGQLSSKIAELTLGFQKQDYDMIKGAWDTSAKLFEERLQTIKDTHDEIQDILKVQRETAAKLEEVKQKKIEATNKIAESAAKNGAPPEVLQAISDMQDDTSGAIQIAGSYLQEGTGTVGEYLFYKREAERMGQVPMSYNDYATMDANRKRPVTNITMAGDSGYTSKQASVITKINDAIAKNATYTKTANMRTYIDNVLTGLSQGTGVGDIAAINQFQKVIDEGAVTRDQDVKLIQGAQSVANQLKTKISALESGQQLSQQQRDDMRKYVQDIMKTQLQVSKNDPFIKAKVKEAEINGIDVEDTILSDLNTESVSTVQDALQLETEAENAVTEWIAQSEENEQRLIDLQSIAPNATMAEIKDQLGI